jgi:hypothetical protein
MVRLPGKQRKFPPNLLGVHIAQTVHYSFITSSVVESAGSLNKYISINVFCPGKSHVSFNMSNYK